MLNELWWECLRAHIAFSLSTLLHSYEILSPLFQIYNIYISNFKVSFPMSYLQCDISHILYFKVHVKWHVFYLGSQSYILNSIFIYYISILSQIYLIRYGIYNIRFEIWDMRLTVYLKSHFISQNSFFILNLISQISDLIYNDLM